MTCSGGGFADVISVIRSGEDWLITMQGPKQDFARVRLDNRYKVLNVEMLPATTRVERQVSKASGNMTQFLEQLCRKRPWDQKPSENNYYPTQRAVFRDVCAQLPVSTLN